MDLDYRNEEESIKSIISDKDTFNTIKLVIGNQISNNLIGNNINYLGLFLTKNYNVDSIESLYSSELESSELSVIEEEAIQLLDLFENRLGICLTDIKMIDIVYNVFVLNLIDTLYDYIFNNIDDKKITNEIINEVIEKIDNEEISFIDDFFEFGLISGNSDLEELSIEIIELCNVSIIDDVFRDYLKTNLQKIPIVRKLASMRTLELNASDKENGVSADIER